MKKEALEFRPARPPLRSLLPTAFLSIVFLAIAPRILAEAAFWPMIGLGGGILLIIGGIWLWFRQRFPGDPTLRVDAKGMSYVRGNRSRSLKWSEVEAILFDFTLDRMLFVPNDGGKPISMRINMITADGRYWAMLIEEYWKPPKKTLA